MSQYSVYSNANPSTKSIYPYIVDVQSPLLDALETRLAIPLSLASRFNDKAIRNLTPIMTVNGLEYVVLAPQMAAIPKRLIGAFVVDCGKYRNEILASIDFLVTGF